MRILYYRMENVFKRINRGSVLDFIKNVLSSRYFPFVTAGVFLVCYYLGWDLVAVYYLGLVTILMLVLLDDVTPVISQLLFINLVVSLKNSPSPSMGGSDFYSKTAVLVQICIVGILTIAALAYRFAVCCAKKKFRATPVFYGLIALSASFLLNGFFNEIYTPNNLLFGFILSFCFLGIFVVIKDNIKADNDCFEKVAYGLIALSALLIIQLIVAYLTTDGLFVDGEINRGALIFGWGVYNTYGLMVMICLPAATYLAGKVKHGYILTAYSFLIVAASILCCSRQTMLGIIIMCPICIIILLVKGKYRLQNLCISGAALVVGCVLVGVFHEKVFSALKTIFENIVVNGELNGSGRWLLWKESIDYFKQFPIFGAGFYIDRSYNAFALHGLVPLMSHNTVLQLLSSCGLFGLVAYTIHRVQTVVSFCKNVTLERTFVALCILTILGLSLIDVHIFNIFPTIIYSCLLAVLVKSEKKEEKKVVLGLEPVKAA